MGTDAVGSPRIVTKSDGAVVREVAYDSFGVESVTGAFDVPIGYAGGLRDAITQKDPTGLVCIGWSRYATVGGGFQFGRDNERDWTADWSVGGEVGPRRARR